MQLRIVKHNGRSSVFYTVERRYFCFWRKQILWDYYDSRIHDITNVYETKSLEIAEHVFEAIKRGEKGYVPTVPPKRKEVIKKYP